MVAVDILFHLFISIIQNPKAETEYKIGRFANAIKIVLTPSSSNSPVLVKVDIKACWNVGKETTTTSFAVPTTTTASAISTFTTSSQMAMTTTTTAETCVARYGMNETLYVPGGSIKVKPIPWIREVYQSFGVQIVH